MRKIIVTLALLFTGVLCFAEDSVEFTGKTDQKEQYGVAEFAVKFNGKVKNPFWDASLSSTWETPSGKQLYAEGFFDGEGIYSLRFVPAEVGTYKYKLTFKTDGEKKSFEGTLISTAGKLPGFLRVSKENCFRFATDNGAAFYPVGIQTCGANEKPSTVLSSTKSPYGALKNETVTPEVYFKEFEGGANLYRVQFGPGDSSGCAFDPVEPKTADSYNLEMLKKTDAMYKTLKANSFHSITTLFQDMSRWGAGKIAFGFKSGKDSYKNTKNSEMFEAAKKYIRYMVARYSAYTDIWEFLNEDDYAPDEWLNEMAAFVKSLDPNKHLLTTNFERPYLEWCDLVTPHEYMSVNEFNVDMYLAKEGCRFKHYKKPILYTEFGNQSMWGNQGRNKWRVAVWSTFFNEMALLFWDFTQPVYSSGLSGPPINAYLGPVERNDFKVFQKFVKEIPVSARTISVYAEEESELRGYGLATKDAVWGYLNHITSHEDGITGLKLRVETGFGKWSLRWIDTIKGEPIGAEELIESSGMSTNIKAPKIKCDLAFVLKRVN